MSEIAVKQRLADLEHEMEISRLWAARSSSLISAAWRLLVIAWVRSAYNRRSARRPA